MADNQKKDNQKKEKSKDKPTPKESIKLTFLQTKTEEQKKSLMTVLISVIMVIIFIGWIFSFKHNLTVIGSRQGGTEENLKNKKELEEIKKSLNGLFENLGNQSMQLKQIPGEVKMQPNENKPEETENSNDQTDQVKKTENK